MQGTNDGKTDTGEAAVRMKERNEEHKEAGEKKRVVGKRTERSL